MFRVSGTGLASPSPSQTASSSPSPSTSATPTPTTTPTPGGPAACTATYRVTNSWPGGFQADVVVTNAGTTSTTGWTVTWTFPDGQVISQLWNGNPSRNGTAVTVDNLDYNGVLGAGSSTSFGFIASWNSTNRPPTDLACRARR
jgi:endoglucanase